MEQRCAFWRAGLLTAAVVNLAYAASGQDTRVIQPSENLVVQGIPPVPAALADEVRRYTESRAAGLADWHPIERGMLITTRFANTTQVHRVRFPGGARTQLTFFDEPVAEALYEPRVGRYFVFTRDVGGNEFTQIYRYDLADGRVTLLTDGGRSQNLEIRWSTQGDRIAYGSTRRNGTDRDIYVMDPADPKSDRLAVQLKGGGWSVLDWSPDDSQLLIREYISINDSRLWLADLKTGGKSLLTEPGSESVAYGRAQFSKDAAGLYLTTDKDSEFQRLAYMDLKTKQLRPLVESIPWDIEHMWDVEAMELSPDGGRIAFVANEAGFSRLYLFNIASRALTQVETGVSGVINELKWHRTGKELGFSMTSARSPSDVYSVDAEGRGATRWTESELGGLVAAEVSEPQLIRWTGFDGQELSGFLYTPPARFAGKRPVLISIHGGPEGQSRPTFLARYNYYINELGVAVLFPNVRGSLGYGKRFLKLDNGLQREDSVKDIGTLLDWIARQPGLDAERVMVSGGSYGGFMTLASAVRYNERIRCAVDIVGISNFNTFLKNTESYRRDLRRVEYGDERDPKMQEFFERIAPLNHVEKITRPLLVVQGGNDPRVPRSEAEQMVERVRKNGTPVSYLLATDEGHGFRKKGNADFQFYAMALFVQQHLLGGQPASAPVKLPEVRFEMHRLGKFRSEALCVADFNGDRKPDVLAGAYLYLAPDWRAVKVRTLDGSVDEEGKGYHDDFMNLPLDVDGDGRLDVVTCGWFSKSVKWYRNTPGEGEWPLIQEEKNGNYEAGQLCDIDGDGKANEILPAAVDTQWFEIGTLPDGKRGLIKHVVSTKAFEYGAGVGDVNGDGRPDIVRPNAWYEGPADPRKGQWIEHTWGDIALGGKDGKPDHTPEILVFDVDGDGLNDVVTSSAHKHGIFWYQQIRTDGKTTWRQHLIDDTWSQPHSLALADLNGDGAPELITGKRFMAHNGSDPDEMGPLGVYYYGLERKPSPKWMRHAISFKEAIGSGVNLCATDLDKDGDIDVVVTGKWGGPVWFENKRN